jgi:hypothetical protein
VLQSGSGSSSIVLPQGRFCVITGQDPAIVLVPGTSNSKDTSGATFALSGRPVLLLCDLALMLPHIGLLGALVGVPGGASYISKHSIWSPAARRTEVRRACGPWNGRLQWRPECLRIWVPETPKICYETGPESSARAATTSNMHSKTSPTRGVPGPELGPNIFASAFNRGPRCQNPLLGALSRFHKSILVASCSEEPTKDSSVK